MGAPIPGCLMCCDVTPFSSVGTWGEKSLPGPRPGNGRECSQQTLLCLQGPSSCRSLETWADQLSMESAASPGCVLSPSSFFAAFSRSMVHSSDVRAHPHKLPQLLGERCASFSGTSASDSARQLVVSRGRAEAAFPPASFLPVRLWQEKCLLGVPPDACWHVPFLPCVILSLGVSTLLFPLAVSVSNVGTVVPSLQVTARIRLDNCFI